MKSTSLEMQNCICNYKGPYCQPKKILASLPTAFSEPMEDASSISSAPKELPTPSTDYPVLLSKTATAYHEGKQQLMVLDKIKLILGVEVWS